MEIFKDPKIDWLGKKWFFIGISIVLIIVGGLSLSVEGLNLGVDFTGGTLVYVKFMQTPQLNRLRDSLRKAGVKAEQATRFDEPAKNEVQIRLPRSESEQAQDLSQESNRISAALQQQYVGKAAPAGKFDLNNVSKSTLSDKLQQLDPDKLRQGQGSTDFVQHYDDLADRIVSNRTEAGGLIKDWSDLKDANVSSAVIDSLQNNAYLGSFTVISVESVGPKVGRELQTRARDAVIFSLLGMLIYIGFRFQPIYGIAGVIALFHDVFITVGFFSLTQKEISLNVIAALLTLVGYSINDTIVVFDRVRENLKLMRRASLVTIVNTSINQTLNRTVLTSGMTFLAVLSLYLFGGEVLNGFSFALVVGILIGTYSSIAIASPIVIWWSEYRERRKALRAA